MKPHTNEAQIDHNQYGSFRSKRAAEQTLQKLVQDYRLCPKLCGLDNSNNACFHYQLKKCQGACIQEESNMKYNLKVELALNQYKRHEWPFKGMIGIKEHCETNHLTQIHVFDQWHHKGSCTNESDLQNIVDNSLCSETTVDDIKIIQSYLKKVNCENIMILN